MDSSEGVRLKDYLLPVERVGGARPLIGVGDVLWKPKDSSALAAVLLEPLRQISADRLHALLARVPVETGEHGPQVTLGRDTVGVDLLGPRQGLWHVPGPTVPAPLEDFRVRPAPHQSDLAPRLEAWSGWLRDRPSEPSSPRLTPELQSEILSLLGDIVSCTYGSNSLSFRFGSQTNFSYGFQTIDALKALFQRLNFTLEPTGSVFSICAQGPFWRDFLNLLLRYYFDTTHKPLTRQIFYTDAQSVLGDRFYFAMTTTTEVGNYRQIALSLRFTH